MQNANQKLKFGKIYKYSREVSDKSSKLWKPSGAVPKLLHIIYTCIPQKLTKKVLPSHFLTYTKGTLVE